MSEQNLSAMTVIELRKLAKELHVPLSAGISKQGIVERLTQAIGESAEKPAAEAPASTAALMSAEASAPPPEPEAAPQEAPSSAPVPAPGFRPAAPAAAPRFNTKPAYQAPSFGNRPAAPRTPPAAEPQRTQTTRPVGFTPRFGPAALEQPAPHREEERPARTEPVRPAYQAVDRRPAYGEAPRFQQRPAFEQPARPAYEQRPAFEQPTRPAYEQRPAFEQPARPAYEQRPAFEQPARPAYEQRPAHDQQSRPTYEQRPSAAPAPSEMLTAAECLDGSGVLELHPDGYGFLRSDSLLPSTKDIYVAAAQVRRFGLRTGDRISGKVRPQRDGDKFSAMLYITEVNGAATDGPTNRPAFEEMTPIYPNRRIRLETTGDAQPASLRLMDLLTPIGFGQRGLILCPPGFDRHTLLQEIASAIEANHPDAALMALLFNENPEDVTSLRDQVSCPVLATTFDMPPEHHLRLADLAVEYAARMVEAKRDVVLLVDDLTVLSRVCTTAALQQGRQVLGSVSPQSLQKAKRLFGSARCLREGGSITIIATMNSDVSNKVDEAIISEFRAAANMELTLDAAAEKGLSLPIDLLHSGTKHVERIASPAQLDAQKLIRRMLGDLPPAQAIPELIKMLDRAAPNEELIARIGDWDAAMQK